MSNVTFNISFTNNDFVIARSHFMIIKKIYFRKRVK